MSEIDILHALRVKGLANPTVLSGLSGVPEADLPAATAPLIERGLVVQREGRLAGYMLTPAGKQAATEGIEADEATAGAKDQLAAFDERFLPINTDFKKVCQSWQQMEDGSPNDHSDAAYDAGVVERLGEIDQRVAPELAQLGETLPRFGRYAPRLQAALEKVRQGDNGAFARPMYDSYHDIWMELHNDVVLSLGRQRGAADEATH